MATLLPRKSSPVVDAQVCGERIRLLYHQGTNTVSASIAVAAGLAYLMWPLVPHANVILWFGIFLGVALLRVGGIIAHRKFETHLAPLTWERFFILGAFLAGCTWALDAVLLFPASSVPHAAEYQFFLALVCMGLAAGAATSLANSLPAFLSFLLPVLLPVAARIIMEPTSLAHVAGFTAIVFCLAMIAVGNVNARTVMKALRLQYINLEMARELEAVATRDTLTGLPNRLILMERMETAIKRANRNAHDVAVLFVDCDNFKAINDTHGHKVGDAYLMHIAQALQSSVRDIDTVARLGGDEFVVLLERCGDRSEVERLVRRIQFRAVQPFTCEVATIVPTLSMGVGLYPGDGSDAETLLHAADEAMYAMKRTGGNGFLFSDQVALLAEASRL